MIVLDASATLDGYFRPDCLGRFSSLLASEQIVVPQHYDAECLNGLRRVDLKIGISAEHSNAFFRFLETVPIIRIPTLNLVGAIWALRKNITAYDASYIAIAQLQGSVLYTHDQILAKAAHRVIETQRLDYIRPIIVTRLQC